MAPSYVCFLVLHEKTSCSPFSLPSFFPFFPSLKPILLLLFVATRSQPQLLCTRGTRRASYVSYIVPMGVFVCVTPSPVSYVSLREFRVTRSPLVTHQHISMPTCMRTSFTRQKPSAYMYRPRISLKNIKNNSCGTDENTYLQAWCDTYPAVPPRLTIQRVASRPIRCIVMPNVVNSSSTFVCLLVLTIAIVRLCGVKDKPPSGSVVGSVVYPLYTNERSVFGLNSPSHRQHPPGLINPLQLSPLLITEQHCWVER